MKQPKRIPVTSFATADRVPIEIVRRQADGFQKAPPVLEELGSTGNYVFILNQQRQIVFASPNVRELIQDKIGEQLLGLRPGEALGCIRSSDSEGGCGTSESCRQCGALQVILASLAGRQDLRDFTLTRFIGCHQETRHLVALATPLLQKGESFSVFTLTDSGDAKARKALEKISARHS